MKEIICQVLRKYGIPVNFEIIREGVRFPKWDYQHVSEFQAKLELQRLLKCQLFFRRKR